MFYEEFVIPCLSYQRHSVLDTESLWHVNVYVTDEILNQVQDDVLGVHADVFGVQYDMSY